MLFSWFLKYSSVEEDQGKGMTPGTHSPESWSQFCHLFCRIQGCLFGQPVFPVKNNRNTFCKTLFMALAGSTKLTKNTCVLYGSSAAHPLAASAVALGRAWPEVLLCFSYCLLFFFKSQSMNDQKYHGFEMHRRYLTFCKSCAPSLKNQALLQGLKFGIKRADHRKSLTTSGNLSQFCRK